MADSPKEALFCSLRKGFSFYLLQFLYFDTMDDMMYDIARKRLVWTIVILAIINALATFFHWYSLVWWFDMPMHFLGGVAAAFFSAVIWHPSRKYVSDTRYFFEIIITTILIGVLWEALELYLYIRFGAPAFMLTDSISDVFFDLSGGLVAVLSLIHFARIISKND